MVAERKWQERYAILTSSPPGRRNVLSKQTEQERPYLATILEAADGVVPVVPRVTAIRSNYNEYTATVVRTAVLILTTKDPIKGLLANLQTQLERVASLK